MHRFEEDPVVPALGAPPGAAGPEYLQHRRPILLCHPRQHGRLLPNRPPSVTDPRTWESTHCILSPIRPHGLKRWRTRLYCADDYTVYGVLLPVGQLCTGKEETHGVERDNARQRHWLARFRRRSIVVSKAQRMVDVSIALFARFAGNDRIGDLISMLA